MTSVTQRWTVGELAQQAGVSVRTLHHYDEIGLLTPTRSAAGHRRYTGSDVARLTQAVALRSLALPLGEIRRCLGSGEALAAALTRQLRDLDLRVAQTKALRDRLATFVARLESGRELNSYDLMTLIADRQMLAEGKTKIRRGRRPHGPIRLTPTSAGYETRGASSISSVDVAVRKRFRGRPRSPVRRRTGIAHSCARGEQPNRFVTGRGRGRHWRDG